MTQVANKTNPIPPLWKDLAISLGSGSSYDNSFADWEWTHLSKNNGTARVGYAKHYLGVRKDAYTADEISFVLTEAFKDMISTSSFVHNFSNLNQELLDEKISEINKYNYKVIYNPNDTYMTNWNVASVILKDIETDDILVNLKYNKSPWSTKTKKPVTNGTLLNSCLGSWPHGGKYGVNHVLRDIATSLLDGHYHKMTY